MSEKKPNPGNASRLSAKALYPARDGFIVKDDRIGDFCHIGYVTERTKRCPCCGCMPVIEQCMDDRDEEGVRHSPAREFVVICPKCELRANGSGEIEGLILAWNEGRYSPDSWYVNHRPKLDSSGAVSRLCDFIVSQAMIDAVDLIKKKHKLTKELNDPLLDDIPRMGKYEELKHVRKELNRLQGFFEESLFMKDYDTDAMLSRVRKILHPDLKPEDRIKIPLKLVKM